MANLVGRSEEWLRLVESGRQSLDSIRIIASLAEVLGIENIAELIEWSTGRHAINRDSGQDHILELFKHAIVDPLDINAAASSPNVSIEELRHGLVRCEEIWHSSGERYSLVAQLLPSIVRDSGRLFWTTMDPAVGEIAIRANHMTRRFLNRMNWHNLAAMVADRSMCISRCLKTSLWTTASAWHVGNAMLRLALPIEAHDIATAAINTLDETVDDTRKQLILRGALLLLAAEAAAMTHNVREADELITLATHLSRELDDEQMVGDIAFGPMAVGLARIEIALLRAEFSEIPRIAAQVEVPEGYSVGDLAHFHIALAYAFAHRNEDVAAAYSLSRAADLCPEEIRYDKYACETMEQLIHRENRLVRRDITKLLARITAST
ncbi:hypothetical protein AWN90_04305 [Nocardia terpenica]|uniref:XRE family transcriptional regulator n=1 Tax=Nocardia terpenica TaxID=455432 RepID=A0A164IXR5_9NOCA|nr:hypothetical protein AWN90_04305 [Nocardia terpenica]